MATPGKPRIQRSPHPHVARRIRIGCAGWSIPGEHRHFFNDEGSVLERYASCLDAVEINSSFYRPHQPKTYARWASSVPETFRFSVKVPKAITHESALVGTAPLVDRFLDECLELGTRLGGLLVQLPPGLHFDARTANAFFGLLRRRIPAEVAIACEPRHVSWFDPKAQAILARYDVNRIGADPSPVTGTDPRVLDDAAVMEGIDPTGETEYWRNEYQNRPYANAQYNYETDYAPAYAYGTMVRSQYADRTWDDTLESDVRSGWEKAKDTSRLTWEQAKEAARDAFDRTDRTYRTYEATDTHYQDEYKKADYYSPEYDYASDYRPAYRYGTYARASQPNRAWDESLESELGSRWDTAKGASRMSWDQAKHAVRDAWHGVERAIPGDADRDGR